jgi:NarL family two-component system sensor histidine kinase LiaS
VVAFVRTSAAALVVFVGLTLGGWSLYAALVPGARAAVGGLFADGAVVMLSAILLVAGLAASVVVGVLGGFTESRGLRRRIVTLHEAAMSWASGRLGHRIVVQGGDDELGELADSLNSMAERLEEQVVALQRLVEKNEKLHAQAASAAAMEERARLARDLHDSVAQQLFALGMTAGAANKLMGVDPERARPFLAQMEEMAAKAQAEMRALLLHLRPVELEGRSLAEALERFLQDVCPRQGIRYDLEVVPELAIGEGMEAQLFRIVQEALSNVIRHASAHHVSVRLLQERAAVLLVIADDGRGFELGQVKDGSYGLHSIRERAQEIGGRLEVWSTPGQGTVLRVVVSRIGQGEVGLDHDSDPVGG